jgi:DNA replication protein
MEFNGFPAKMRFTPIPNPVFSSLLPQIHEINELKVLLHIFELIYVKKGSVRFVTAGELASHPNLVNSLDKADDETLHNILENLTAKQAVICLNMDRGGSAEDLYLINDPQGREAAQKILAGEVKIPRFKPVLKFEKANTQNEDIYSLYEKNVGIITPLIAEELKEAQKGYPEDWIKDAIKEAVDLNKRSWRYISRILERWSTEGREDGTHRGNIKKDTDPDKYIKGKYGHIVRR